ncbi:MAG: hypothetical protein LBG43_11470 [Treponema sp.]|jgi:hypothetical protein|nr:hypothetical protein [Treponema sp.]
MGKFIGTQRKKGERGKISKNGMQWKAAFLFLLFCLKPPDAAHPVDIDFAWSLGDFKFAFNNGGVGNDYREVAFDFAFTAFSFDIFETYTGLGVKISPFSVETVKAYDLRSFLLPVEIYYNPFVFRLNNWTSFNMGVYVRGGYGFLLTPFARYPGDGFYGAAGARIFFATLPIGRKPVVDYSSGEKGFYYISASLFAEYTSVNTVKIGISLDNIVCLAILLGAIFQ